MTAPSTPTGSSFEAADRRARFSALYDAWCDRAYGCAVSVTSSPRGASDVAVDAWAMVWERWSEFVSELGRDPDDGWLDRQLRCAVLRSALSRASRMVDIPTQLTGRTRGLTRASIR